MRITGGYAKGRLLKGPGKKLPIRPSSDRVREAIFSLLGDRTAGSLVLDLFAGTGALGIEALSRHARFGCFVDRSRPALRLIATNLHHCLPDAAHRLIQQDLSRPASLSRISRLLPANTLFDLIFLDPPYQKNLAEKTLVMVDNATILSTTGTVIVEEQADQSLPASLQHLQLHDHRRYGETGIWIYHPYPSDTSR